MNPEYFVCLLLEYFFQINVLNEYQNTPKNAKITCCIKKKTLQHPKLGKLKFGIHKIGCSMSWMRYKSLTPTKTLTFHKNNYKATVSSLHLITISTYGLTSVPKISIPSTVVIHYCAWYTYFRNRRVTYLLINFHF